MRRLQLLLFSVSFLFFTNLNAQQSQRKTLPVEFPSDATELNYFAELPYVDQLPFFSFFVEWPQGTLDLELRFTDDLETWTKWETLHQDPHNTEKGITEIYIGKAAYRFFQLKIARHDLNIETATLHFYHPGLTGDALPTVADADPVYTSACPCPQPGLESRTEWCPSGDCPGQTSPTPTNVTHMIVHHSAGTNSANDWAAIVRAIWDYHVNGNGWSDIGYNYLVDPNGVIYEGRGYNILGAHFCGMNSGTMGVCMMGDFTDIEPTNAALESLERLLAWKSCDIGADPLGESFHASSGGVLKNISGHRDGCSTACPGDSFYPLLPQVRVATNNQILANCAGLSSPISLVASEIDETSYFLSWSHNSPDETGFQLERSEDGGGTFELRAEIGANLLTFIETDLELERIYQYRIRAYNEVDTSDYSNIVIINTGVVGTNQATLPQDALTLSPNPTKDLLQLSLTGEWQGAVQVRLMDLTQHQLLAKQSQKHTTQWNEQLDMRDLPTGTYLLSVEVDGQRGIWKVVKG
ncbi:N-acetylmuramoyl-L-alanine amidase [Lewinella sp. LCG006]|uniref:N-acetylmuramoyl-L-alanine amidase n=1 Tax=Lewinella sp. LCG006 TaxID=3231911 RepID=UPI0034612BD8